MTKAILQFTVSVTLDDDRPEDRADDVHDFITKALDGFLDATVTLDRIDPACPSCGSTDTFHCNAYGGAPDYECAACLTKWHKEAP